MPDSTDRNSNKSGRDQRPTSPEPATVVIPKVMSQRVQPQRAQPQRVGVAAAPAQPGPSRIEPQTSEPAPRSGKAWYIAVVAAVVAVGAAVGVAVFVSGGDNGPSAEAQVQVAVSTYVDALNSGDLATLRTATCGSLADYYRDIPDDAFAQVHENAVTQKTIPQVSAVDAVRITDDTAIAQVQATIPSSGEQSWRTFDLERQDNIWKVCDPSQTGG